jgi:hypothetical protein
LCFFAGEGSQKNTFSPNLLHRSVGSLAKDKKFRSFAFSTETLLSSRQNRIAMRKRIVLFSLALAGCLLGQAGYAQKSNVYLFDFQQEGASIKLSKPRYLTAFNAQGYNTDPTFFSPHELYIAVRLPRASQTDIYKLDLQTRSKAQVTATNESEFMPVRMPEYYSFSAVRQEREGRDSVLRLWQFPVDQLTSGKPIFKYVKDIRRYMWLNSQELVIYQEGNPSRLSFANTNNDQVTIIDTDVGRHFTRLPNGNLAYVKKSPFDTWTIKEKNLYRRNEDPRVIMETLSASDCFTVLPDGTYLAAKGSKLYKFTRFADSTWQEVADLRSYEIRNISQLQISPDSRQLAIVAD